MLYLFATKTSSLTTNWGYFSFLIALVFVYKSQDQVLYTLKSYVLFAIPFLLLLQGLCGQNLYIVPIYYVYLECSRAIIWKPCKHKYVVHLLNILIRRSPACSRKINMLCNYFKCISHGYSVRIKFGSGSACSVFA